MVPIKKIEELITKHSLLEKELSLGQTEKKQFAEKSKEYSDLNDIIEQAKQYSSFEKEKNELEKIIDGSDSENEMKVLASSELKELKKQHEINEKILKLFLLPKDEADKKNAIIEIRAGTGGLEASLFASDLFKMYEKVSHKKKWQLELISISKSDAGGLKEVIALIKGRNIYSTLKYESGVHRVQRVPDTETQGRVHTSAATVAVLPEAEEVDVKIEDKDLRIDVFRSSGPGGQSVNTTDSAVRITHIPTGIVVSQQDEKSQIRNKEKGLKILRSRIYELERQKKEDERSKDRKSKIGTGDRSERIRTYNFPQGRITDHRINFTLHKLEEFMEGEIFDEMIENLNLQAQAEKLNNLNWMNIQTLLNQAIKTLDNSSNTSSKLDSEILLSKIIKKNRKYLILNSNEELKKENIKSFDYLVKRRKKGEPIAYLINKKEFWKQNFYINQNVLIPRPDTEILVEETLKLFNVNSKLNMLDIGTGSGCILLSILKERRNFFGTGIDISKKAINVARFNAKMHQLSNRVKFYNSDVDKFLIGKYDLVVSNPPYIKRQDLKYLEVDVKGFEPKLALDGGKDGFSKITKVISKTSTLLKRNGRFILEIGFGQKKKILSILKQNNFFINKVVKDYGKNDRCVISTKI